MDYCDDCEYCEDDLDGCAVILSPVGAAGNPFGADDFLDCCAQISSPSKKKKFFVGSESVEVCDVCAVIPSPKATHASSPSSVMDSPGEPPPKPFPALRKEVVSPVVVVAGGDRPPRQKKQESPILKKNTDKKKVSPLVKKDSVSKLAAKFESSIVATEVLEPRPSESLSEKGRRVSDILSRKASGDSFVTPFFEFQSAQRLREEEWRRRRRVDEERLHLSQHARALHRQKIEAQTRVVRENFALVAKDAARKRRISWKDQKGQSLLDEQDRDRDQDRDQDHDADLEDSYEDYETNVTKAAHFKDYETNATKVDYEDRDYEMFIAAAAATAAEEKEQGKEIIAAPSRETKHEDVATTRTNIVEATSKKKDEDTTRTSKDEDTTSKDEVSVVASERAAEYEDTAGKERGMSEDAAFLLFELTGLEEDLSRGLRDNNSREKREDPTSLLDILSAGGLLTFLRACAFLHATPHVAATLPALTCPIG